MSKTNLTPESTSIQTHPTGELRAELERIKAAKWPAETSVQRDARLARMDAASAKLPKWDDYPVKLDAETIRYIAESYGVYEDED